MMAFQAAGEPAISVDTKKKGKRGRGSTLLGACRLVPNVVRDGGGRHGEARFAGRGRSYD